MPENYTEFLEQRFGSVASPERCAQWELVTATLRIGDWIDGTVIKIAPFGVWIDFGKKIPGLLLVTDFRPRLKPAGEADWPSVGDLLRSRLLGFAQPIKEVRLTQVSDKAD